MIDERPLSLLTHPAGGDEAAARAWLTRLRGAGVPVRVPEIADYELRREPLQAGRVRSVERLDLSVAEAGLLPITPEAMRLAAGIWVEARNQGQPTAPDAALDADVILAAEARLAGEGAVVATTNPNHLPRFVAALHGREVTPESGAAGEGVPEGTSEEPSP